MRSSWSAVLWESDIPIDLQLPQECMCVCPHDAHPLIPFEHPSVATQGDKLCGILCNSATIWQQQKLGDIYLNSINVWIGEKMEGWLTLLQHFSVKTHTLKLCIAGINSRSGLRVEGRERRDGEWKPARVVYQYQRNVWDHPPISPDLHAFKFCTLLCH